MLGFLKKLFGGGKKKAEIVSLDEFMQMDLNMEFHDPESDDGEGFEGDEVTMDDWADLQRSFEFMEREVERAKGLGALIAARQRERGEKKPDDDLAALLAQEAEAEAVWRSRDEETGAEADFNITIDRYQGDDDEQRKKMAAVTERMKAMQKEPLGARLRKKLAAQYAEASMLIRILMLGGAGVLGLAILAISISLVISLVGAIGGALERDEPAVFVAAPHGFNNAAHIFTNLAANVGEQEITVGRLILDPVATVIYLDEYYDQTRYIFTLRDFDGNFYPKFAWDSDSTALRFAPLNPGVSGMIISITDIVTNEVYELTFYIDEEISPAVHISRNYPAFTNDPDIFGGVTAAQFSPSGSAVHFSINSQLGPRASLVFVDIETHTPLRLRHFGGIVPAARGGIELHSFDNGNLILGRADFRPLRSLTGVLEIDISHLFVRHEINEISPALGLFIPGAHRARTRDLGDFTITLEGMQHQGDFVVMPMHGVNTTIFAGANTEVHPVTFNRVEVFACANLIGITDTGRRETLASTARHDMRGADIRFDMRDNEAFRDIPPGRLYLEINAIYIRTSDLNLEIDLDNHWAQPPCPIAIAYGDRLLNLVDTRGQQDDFIPNASARQIRTIDISGDRIYAVIIEQFTRITAEGVQTDIFTHQITAQSTPAGLTILNQQLVSN
ncbi:MAG: hypothetical protein FWB71_05340 [Defluviitaleaceae bacterium]|nr:hypothetical protein [Defluviitaleaceae bacterium]